MSTSLMTERTNSHGSLTKFSTVDTVEHEYDIRSSINYVYEKVMK